MPTAWPGLEKQFQARPTIPRKPPWGSTVCPVPSFSLSSEAHPVPRLQSTLGMAGNVAANSEAGL